MKYALSIFSFTMFVIFSSNAHSRTITKFRDSDAIITVAQFMYDAAEDMPLSARLSDKKINIKDFSRCTKVSSAEVLVKVEEAVKSILRLYPDEEIPFEQAIIDLEDYLDHQTYKKCVLEKKGAQSTTKTYYFVDFSDKIHLRLDNIALNAE